MTQRRGFHILILALSLLVAGGVAATAQGQKPTDPKAQDPNAQVVQTKPEKARGGADTNVKSETRMNTEGKEPRQAPPQKGGEKARGGVCDVHFDNRSPWWVHVYVDGNYEGLMPPWGDVYAYAISGPTRLYARAEFDTGGRLTWGPITVRCPAGGSYSWQLGR